MGQKLVTYGLKVNSEGIMDYDSIELIVALDPRCSFKIFIVKEAIGP